MHFSLVLIGAHNGSKPAERIAEAQAGQALKNASRPGAGKLARMLRILFEK